MSNDTKNYQVYIGNYLCEATEILSDRIICNLGYGSMLYSSKKYTVDLYTNFGFSMAYKIYEFQLIPKLTSIDPSIGMDYI